MSNIVEFPAAGPSSDDEVFDRASLWIAKMSRGLSASETRELQKWLAIERHREVLFKMAEVWDKMDDLNRLADLFQVPPEAPGSTRIDKTLCQRFTAYGAYAATLLFLVSAVTYAIISGLSSEGENFEQIFVTARGETSTLELLDGSTLALNTDGHVRVRYSSKQRLFILEQGEMSIDVAHDSARPLTVIAGDKLVQAIGTAFNVQINNSHEVELIVTEGKVRVDRVPLEKINKPLGRLPSTAMTIAGGEKVILGSEKEKITSVEQADIAVDLGWRQGNLIFRGETLDEALLEISRYTDVKFELTGQDLGKKKIAGLFKIGDIDGLLTTLDQSFHITSERASSGKIILRAQ